MNLIAAAFLLLVVVSAVVLSLYVVPWMEDRAFPPLRVKRLDPRAKLPVRGNPYAAGLDFFQLDDAVLQPGETKVLSCGVACEIPEGYVGITRPRSSARIKGLIIQGTIDSDYRGALRAVVTNVSRAPVLIHGGTAIMQMILMPYSNIGIEEVDALSETERGEKGFGSTGHTARS